MFIYSQIILVVLNTLGAKSVKAHDCVNYESDHY